MYVGSLDPAARCGKPCVWPQYGDAGGEVRELVRCGDVRRACALTVSVAFLRWRRPASVRLCMHAMFSDSFSLLARAEIVHCLFLSSLRLTHSIVHQFVAIANPISVRHRTERSDSLCLSRLSTKMHKELRINKTIPSHISPWDAHVHVLLHIKSQFASSIEVARRVTLQVGVAVPDRRTWPHAARASPIPPIAHIVCRDARRPDSQRPTLRLHGACPPFSLTGLAPFEAPSQRKS